MIDWSTGRWVWSSDLISLGNKKVDEIWMGNKKIYPNGNAKWREFLWTSPSIFLTSYIHRTLNNLLYEESLNSWWLFNKNTNTWSKTKLLMPELPTGTSLYDIDFWTDGIDTYANVELSTGTVGNLRMSYVLYILSNNDTRLIEVNRLPRNFNIPFTINGNTYTVKGRNLYRFNKTEGAWYLISNDNGLLSSYNSGTEYIWTTNDNHIYCSIAPHDGYGSYADKFYHYEFNPQTNKFETKEWFGVTEFSPSSIVYGGDDIYLLKRIQTFPETFEVYYLDKDTSTWLYREDPLYEDLDDIRYVDQYYAWDGSHLMRNITNGIDDYRTINYNCHYKYNKETKKFEWVDIFGLVDESWWQADRQFIYGNLVWSDGDNVYCIYGNKNFILDSNKNGWCRIDLGDDFPFYNMDETTIRNNTWSYNKTIYYSGAMKYDSTSSIQKRFDKINKKWLNVSWYYIDDNDERQNFYPSGVDIWSDGNKTYYSASTKQYVLDSGSIWRKKEWINMRSFSGRYIWTDGVNIYYSSGHTHKILNKSSSEWEDKEWNGLTSFYPQYIWTDGKNIFYSETVGDLSYRGYYKFLTNKQQYVLNKETSTWIPIVWSETNNIDGRFIWKYGDNIYCSLGTSDETAQSWNHSFPNGIDGQYYLIKGDITNG